MTRQLSPYFPDDTLKASILAGYGIDAAQVRLLPFGADSWAWAYRVQTKDGKLYFLKVRKRTIDEYSLQVPHLLNGYGITQVIAPIPNNSGSLSTKVDDCQLVLYSFVEGNTGKLQGMTTADWIGFGQAVRRIHDSPIPAEFESRMNKETFLPSGVGLVQQVESHVAEANPDDGAARSLIALWVEKRSVISELVRRAEESGRQLASVPHEFVICHADMHTSNLIIGTDNQLWLVDWDETVLAPRERDLMFVVGGGISKQLVRPGDEELFLEGYGQTTIDLVAIAYYRYAWAVSDIGEFATQALCRPDIGPDGRRKAVDFFMTLFQPGNIVDLALTAQV